MALLAVMGLLLMVGAGCRDNEVSEPEWQVSEFLPLAAGNWWIYKVEGISENAEVSSVEREVWRVNEDLFIENYHITPSGIEEYLGYKIVFLHQDGAEITDVVGTYLTTSYRHLPSDSLVLIASNTSPVPRKRWIYGGLLTLETDLGTFLV